MRNFVFVCSLAILISSTFLLAGEAAKPVKKNGDKKAVEMDYGPCLAATVGLTKENIAYKGMLISLNKERTQNVLFDTELLRVTAAWTGDYLTWGSRAFADNNNDFCMVLGDVQFETSRLPGWSKSGERADPRNPKDGPLPADWAKYKGVYLHGEKTILSYTVGTVPVLEMFAFHAGNTGVFDRIIEVGPSQKEMEIFVIEGEHDDKHMRGLAPDKSNVQLWSEKSTIYVQLYGAPDATWERKPIAETPARSRVYLKIPPHAESLKFKIAHYKIQRDKPSNSLHDANEKLPDLKSLTQGGAPRWTEKIETKGALAKEDAPYVMDTLTAPEVNPYKSWLRFTGLDFFADGRAAVCTWNGDVWVVSGIDAGLEKLSWKRFATGLNNPMGIKIVDGLVHTIGRDQITKLHDLNQDGEADFYENFNNDFMLTTNFHEMCFDLQTDKDGNFYFAKGASIWAGELRMTAHAGTLIKVSKDGAKMEVICNGLRAPNGIGISPDGEITCSDNQGNWIPACPINLIKKDGYYGWVGKDQKSESFKTPDKPLCWIPHTMDKSSSGQIWVDKTNNKWGPFAGRMLLASYDCWLMSVFVDRIDGEAQGGVIKFPIKFASGMMRPRFNPIDGQLYVAGLRGWSSSAARDCALQRIRYTGKPVCMPLEARLTKTGFDVVFSDKLDAAVVADRQVISAEWFNVVRSGGYGSNDFAPSDPKKKGREPLEITAQKLKEDGKTVELTIPNLKPVTNIILKFKLKSADGAAVNYDVSYTINRMP